MKVGDLVNVRINGAEGPVVDRGLVINCKQPVDKYGFVLNPNNYAYDVHLFEVGTFSIGKQILPVFESEIEEFK